MTPFLIWGGDHQDISIHASNGGTTKKGNENRIEFDLQIKCFDSPERMKCPRLHVHQNKLAEF